MNETILVAFMLRLGLNEIIFGFWGLHNGYSTQHHILYDHKSLSIHKGSKIKNLITVLKCVFCVNKIIIIRKLPIKHKF